jgi:Na+-driven multidrug efflux pump
MVGQVVGAVAPVVVQSATSEDGLLNKLFKVYVLFAFTVIIVLSIFIGLWVLDTDIISVLTNAPSIATGFVAGLLPFGISQPFRVLQIGLTGLASGFAFRR